MALQSGDEETRAIWRDLIDISLAGFNAAYARLNVMLTDEHLAGESIYNDDLASVADELEANGVAVIDDGALCRLRARLQRTDDRPQDATAATATRSPIWPRCGTGSATCTPTG